MIEHSPRTFILSRTAVIATLAIAFALVLSTALLSAFAARNLARTDRWSDSASQAVSATTHLLATLAAAEAELAAAQTGTADEQNAFAAARTRLRDEVLALPDKLHDRPDLRPHLTQLEGLSRDLDDAAARWSAIDEAAQTAPLLTRFAEMRQLLFGLHRQEFAALVDHSASAAARARGIQSLNGGLIAVALTLAVAGTWILLRRRSELEGLITVCAWTRRVQWQGHWITFEEYLARRFNLRCTHGICDEAAAEMRDEVLKSRVPADLRRS